MSKQPLNIVKHPSYVPQMRAYDTLKWHKLPFRFEDRRTALKYAEFKFLCLPLCNGWRVQPSDDEPTHWFCQKHKCVLKLGDKCSKCA